MCICVVIYMEKFLIGWWGCMECCEQGLNNRVEITHYHTLYDIFPNNLLAVWGWTMSFL